jgi:CheY-like chemotaxis protein
MIRDRKLLALLVEDDEDARAIYATFLSCDGFEVLTADSASPAFDAAVAYRPDVIIADVRLPGTADGITLTLKLRLDPRTTRIPIIIITGNALPQQRERGMAAGCDLFLTKPCTPDALAEHARTLADPPLAIQRTAACK